MDELGFGHSGSVSNLKLNPSLYYDIQRYHYYSLRVESQLSLKHLDSVLEAFIVLYYIKLCIQNTDAKMSL